MENSIYGVDIEKGAVDIARLRFWLAMIVEENEPMPLPNLHFKIMHGNSLIESYRGLDLSDLTRVNAQKTFWDSSNSERESLVSDLKRYYGESDHTERQRIFDSIIKNVRRQIHAKDENLSQKGLDPSDNSQFFLWHTWFTDVFEKGGFDIVIGNPPYVSAVNMARTIAEKKVYKDSYPEAIGAYDLYVLFLLLGAKISKGIYSWIIPNKLLIAEYAAPTLRKLKEEYRLISSIDVSVYDVFKTASVYPIIILGNKGSDKSFTEYYLEQYDDLLKNKLIEKSKVNSSGKVRLTDMGVKICSGATGFEAQKIKQNITENACPGTIPFTVSGNIDRYTYNNVNVRYMKGKYSSAHIYLNDAIAESKQNMWKSPKIIIAGMTKQIEACYVKEPLAIGVGVYAIYDFAGYDPFYLLGVLNAKATTKYLISEFSDKHLAGGYLAINKSTIEQFLFPSNVDKGLQKKIADIARQIHQQKQTYPTYDTSVLEANIDELVNQLHSTSNVETK
jgi:hypothetical protein